MNDSISKIQAHFRGYLIRKIFLQALSLSKKLSDPFSIDNPLTNFITLWCDIPPTLRLKHIKTYIRTHSKIINLESKVKSHEHDFKKQKEEMDSIKQLVFYFMIGEQEDNPTTDTRVLVFERDNAREAVKQMLNFVVQSFESIAEEATKFGDAMWQVDNFKRRALYLANTYDYTKLYQIVDNEFTGFFDWVEHQIKNIELSNSYWSKGMEPWTGSLTGES